VNKCGIGAGRAYEIGTEYGTRMKTEGKWMLRAFGVRDAILQESRGDARTGGKRKTEKRIFCDGFPAFSISKSNDNHNPS